MSWAAIEWGWVALAVLKLVTSGFVIWEAYRDFDAVRDWHGRAKSRRLALLRLAQAALLVPFTWGALGLGITAVLTPNPTDGPMTTSGWLLVAVLFVLLTALLAKDALDLGLRYRDGRRPVPPPYAGPRRRHDDPPTY